MILVKKLKDLDGTIEANSKFSTTFQTSNEEIATKENEKNAAFKRQNTEISTSSNEIEAVESSYKFFTSIRK